MAMVSIRRAAAAEGNLPARCLCCGEPTDGFVMQSFSWSPASTRLGILLSRFHFRSLLMWEDLRTTARVRLPLCPRHREHWGWRAWLYWGGFIAILFFMVLVLFHEGRVEDGVWRA